jgi:hypothetical protein
MPRIRPVVLALLLVAAAGAQAQSDLYRCADSAGHATFTDDAGRRELLRTKRAESCDRLSGLPVTSVPASRNTPRSAAAEASRTQASPANFPRVEADTQRLRDTDRRRILEEELRTEEDKLARLRNEEKSVTPDRAQRLRDDIGRSENNLAALKRELAFLRQ